MEYNLIHDPSKREPDIEVNSKAVDTWLYWANMTGHGRTWHPTRDCVLAEMCSNLKISGRLPESHDRRKRHGGVQRLCRFCEDPLERHPRICDCGRHARDERRRHGFFPFCLLQPLFCGVGHFFFCQLSLAHVSLK